MSEQTTEVDLIKKMIRRVWNKKFHEGCQEIKELLGGGSGFSSNEVAIIEQVSSQQLHFLEGCVKAEFH